MVNHKRIRRKLPELMIDGPLTDKQKRSDYYKLDRQIQRLQRQNPVVVNMRVLNIARELKALEDTLKATF